MSWGSQAKSKAKAKAATAKAKAKAAMAKLKQQQANLKEATVELTGVKGKYSKLKEQFRKWRHSHKNDDLAKEYANTSGMFLKANEARMQFHHIRNNTPCPPSPKKPIGRIRFPNEYGSGMPCPPKWQATPSNKKCPT